MSLALVNIFTECIKEGLSNREWWVSTSAIPGSAPSFSFREESKVDGGGTCDAGLGFGSPTARSSSSGIGEPY